MGQKLRLSENQIKLIKETILGVFNKKVKIYIFGSRSDLSKRGGDIDILVKVDNNFKDEEKYNLKKEIITKLYKKVGERKIDLLIINEPQNLFEKIAIKQGKEI